MNVRSILCVFFGVFAWTLSPSFAEVTLNSVEADGRSIAFSAASSHDHASPATLRIPASAKNLAFHFQSGSKPPSRLRHKLEGIDSDWRDLPSIMVVWLRILDEDANPIAGNTVNIAGESPGWNGRPSDTPLTPFSISTTVPMTAPKIRLYFITNGRGPVVGQWIIDAVTVRVEHADGTPQQKVELSCQAVEQANVKTAIPINWIRDGERLELAQMLWRNTQPAKPVLLLNDDLPDQFGCWRSRDIALPLEKDDKVSMECQMAYTIGCGAAAGTAEYSHLNPGTYWFRVAAFQVNGLPTGEEVSIPVVVLPPLTHRLSFWITLLITIACFVGVTVRWVTQQQNRRQMELLERRRMLEEERNRIARDIHDDLGTTLSQIAMLSEMAKEEKPEGQERRLLGNIFNHAQQATRALDETIWAIRPSNDTLGHLIEYLCQFAENHLQLAGLRFRLDVPETIPDFSLTSLERQNLLLATKEALHNVVKHAKATEVWLRIRISGDVLSLLIEDNGCGQVPAADSPPSRGSANMKKRMEQINGCYTRTGVPGQGPIVEFQVQMRRRGREP